ncbi:MAG: helix-turn-helix domain-containing protein [Muribaculaceae bacterium]|nr:helix-turn-helix domain-containing protein [Muribaculaceae bacterium]
MESLKTYSIHDFLNMPPGPGVNTTAFERDYVVVELKPGSLAKYELPPSDHIRFEGMLLTFVRHGSIQIEFENHVFTATDNSIFCIPPSIPTIITSDDWATTELTVIYLSRDFLQNLNFSLSAFSGPVVLEHRSPVCPVNREDAETLQSYFHLLILTARDKSYPRLTRQCAASLCVGLSYYCIRIFIRQLEFSGMAAPPSAAGRKTRSAHVRDFIRMVHADFARERSVGYYASALCVSPKYLSALVKETTGRTAARWIEDYVIMEAKNLLRYSGKNVQQVAYALNFPNQSAFGKYFKHITGMSPTEFQKV